MEDNNQLVVDAMWDDLHKKGYFQKDKDTFDKFFFAPGEEGYNNRYKLWKDLHSKGYLESPTYEDFAARIGLQPVQKETTAPNGDNSGMKLNDVQGTVMGGVAGGVEPGSYAQNFAYGLQEGADKNISLEGQNSNIKGRPDLVESLNNYGSTIKTTPTTTTTTITKPSTSPSGGGSTGNGGSGASWSTGKSVTTSSGKTLRVVPQEELYVDDKGKPALGVTNEDVQSIERSDLYYPLMRNDSINLRSTEAFRKGWLANPKYDKNRKFKEAKAAGYKAQGEKFKNLTDAELVKAMREEEKKLDGSTNPEALQASMNVTYIETLMAAREWGLGDVANLQTAPNMVDYHQAKAQFNKNGLVDKYENNMLTGKDDNPLLIRGWELIEEQWAKDEAAGNRRSASYYRNLPFHNPKFAEEFGAYITARIKRTGERWNDAVKDAIDDFEVAAEEGRVGQRHSEEYLGSANREQVDELLGNVNSSLEKRMAELDKKESDMGWFSNLGNVGAAPDTKDSKRLGDPEYGNYLWAGRALNDAKKIIAAFDANTLDDGLVGFFKGAGRGLVDSLGDLSTWDGGISDLLSAQRLDNAVGKFINGKPLTKSEKALLEATSLKMATAAIFKEIGRGYKAGKVTGASLPFMIDMALNPLSKSGNTIAKGLAKYAQKHLGKYLEKIVMKLGRSSAGKIATKILGSGVTKKAVKAAARAAGDIVAAGGMSATSGVGHSLANAYGYHSGKVQYQQGVGGKTHFGGVKGGDDWVTSTLKGFGSTTIENASEMWGEYFKPITKFLSGVGGKALEKMHLGAVNRWLEDINSTEMARLAADFRKQTRWDGSIAEYFEEVAGNIANALTIKDMNFALHDKNGKFSLKEEDSVFNAQDNLDTFLGVSLMSGSMGAVNIVGYRTPKYRAKQDMKRYGDMAKRIFAANSNDWSTIASLIQNNNEDSRRQLVVDLMQSGKYSKREKQIALQYAGAVYKSMGMDIGESKQQRSAGDQEASEAYGRGYNMATLENIGETSSTYQQLRTQMEQDYGTELMQRMDKEPGLVYGWIRNGAVSEEDAKKVLDYLNAKMAYEGAVDRLNDDEAAAKSAAELQVEDSAYKEENGGDGQIHPVTLKGREGEFFVVSGDVVTGNDGAVDVNASSDAIVVVDNQGKRQMTTAKDIDQVGDVIDVESAKADAVAKIETAAQETTDATATDDAVVDEDVEQGEEGADGAGAVGNYDGVLDAMGIEDDQARQALNETWGQTPPADAMDVLNDLMGENNPEQRESNKEYWEQQPEVFNSQWRYMMGDVTPDQVNTALAAQNETAASDATAQSQVQAQGPAAAQGQPQVAPQAAAAQSQPHASTPTPQAATTPGHYEQDDDVVLNVGGEQITGFISNVTPDGKLRLQLDAPIDGNMVIDVTPEELDKMVAQPQSSGANAALAAQDGTAASAPTTPTTPTAPASQPAQAAAPETPQQASAQPSTGIVSDNNTPIPMVDGKTDYSAATPERAHHNIYNERGLSKERADKVVNAAIAKREAEAAAANEAVAKARRALEKHQAKDIDIDNIDADMAEEQRLADALRDAEAQAAQAQNAVDYWKRVKDVEDAANRSAEESAASGEVAAPAAPQETAGETQAPAPQEESSMLSANESGEPSSTQTNEGERGEETTPAAEEELTPDERIERARMQALENRAEELAESCGIPVRICRSLEEIPARYRKAFETARGTGKKKSYVNGFFFHKKTANGEINEIVLYLPDIAANGGMWRLERTFLHEAVAHGGLRALFQNAQDGIQTFNDLCDKVWNEIMPTGEKRKYRDYVLQNKYGQEPYEEIKKQYRKEGKSLDDLMTDALKREAADEYMAHQAEWGVDRSILDKIIKAVRDALRKIKMINKRMRLSDRDVLDLLAASHRNLTEMDKQMLNQDVADELDRLALAGEDNGGSTLMSTTSIMEGGGLEVSREITDKDGKVTKEPLVDDEGNLVAKYNGKEYSAKNPITAEDLREGDMEGNEATVLQMLINDARDAKNITDEQAAKIYQNYADMINLFLKCGSAENGGADTVMENWEWLGESVFRAVSANGDAQYSYSMDITKVCKKNEAVIKSISALQLREGRGATPSEIVEIYRDTHVEGYQVPCPVCYVFTRYIRNGKYASAAITGMEEYGEHLPGGKNPWTLKQWRDELNRLDRTMNPDSKQKCTDAEKEQAKRFKKQLDEANDITVYYEDRVNALSFLLTSKFTSEARKKEILEELRVIDAQYKAAVNIIARQSLTNWIKTFAIQEKDGKWTMREDAKIPEDMDDFKKNALDLRLTANTILNYPAIQRLRKSGGSAAGKEISFPSDNRLGEVVSGLGINKSNLNTYSNVYEEVLKAPNEKERKKLRKKASDRFKAASEYAQQQTLRGGQRMWSWSDNIERLSPDIAINIMQLQLLGGAMQTYSKQLEGIKLAAQMGAYVNGSLMAKDNGWEEVKDSECYERDGELWLKKDRYDYVNEPRVGKRPRKRKRIIAAKDSHVYQAEDGRKYVLVYDDVVGVDPFGNEHNGERKKGLFQLNSELDRAGNILVGMNDLHVRAAMADPAVFFIIPWHSSGAHNHILNEMLEILGQHMTDRLDYTAMQEEKNMLERNKDTKKLPEVTQRLRDLWEEGRQWAEQNKWKSGMEVDSNGDLITESQYMYRALRGLIFDGSIFEAMPTEEQYQVAVEIVTNMQATVDELNARNEAWKAKSPEYKKSPEGKAEKKEIDDARTKANKNYKPAVHTIELHDGLIDWRDSSVNAEDAEWQAQHPKRINVEEARRIIEADEFLKQVYDRVSKTPGQKMTSGDNTYIYPYEYWQETDAKGKPADIKDADINGKRYVEYCRRMGYKPKFSGNWKTGDVEKQNQGNFVHDPGYWKLLIDRRMYDRNGKYQWLDPVDSDNFETSLVDPRETHKEFHVTKVADDKAADEIAQKVFERLSTRTESGFAAADYNKPLKKIMDEYDAALAAGVQNGKIKLTAAEESMVERMKAATVANTLVDENSTEEIQEMQNTTKGWLTTTNLDNARVIQDDPSLEKSTKRQMIIDMFDKVDPKVYPVNFIPQKFLKYIWGNTNDNRAYSAIGYFIEHVVGHHPEIDIAAYEEMIQVVSDPDRIVETYRYIENLKKYVRSIVFVRNVGGHVRALGIGIEQSNYDKEYRLFHKTFYGKGKLRADGTIKPNKMLKNERDLWDRDNGENPDIIEFERTLPNGSTATFVGLDETMAGNIGAKKITKSPLMGGGTIIGSAASAAPRSSRISPPNGQLVQDGKGTTKNETTKENSEKNAEKAEKSSETTESGDGMLMSSSAMDQEREVDGVPAYEANNLRFSVLDPERDADLIAELDGQEYVTVYRTMAKVNGEYYPPMDSRDHDNPEKLRNPEKLGQYTQSEERPDLAYAEEYIDKKTGEKKTRWKFNLKKSNGKSVDGVAYNPYMHTSDSALNDQFSEAQDRDDLVVVECRVPVSELDPNSYHAEKALDPVGWKPWKAGPIVSKMTGKRNLLLSRWVKPVKELSWSEVADMVSKQLGDQFDVLPSNTFSKGLRAELEKRGYQFIETDNKGIIKSGLYKGVTWSDRYYDIHPEKDNRSNKKAKRAKVAETKARNAEAGEGVMFSTSEAVATLKDDERVYNDLLGKVFSGVSNETRRGIVGDAMENRGYDFGAATEAWLMGLADDESFAQVPQEDWRAVKNALGNALRENGVEGEMSDNEARYVLWKAGQIEDGVFSMAEDIVKRDELLNGANAPQYTDSADVRFSTSESEEDGIQFSVTPRDRAIARDQYDRMMRSGRYQFVEAVQDSMLGLKKLMEAIMGDSYEYIEDIPMYENPYITENLMSSSNAAQQHEYSNRLMAPILKEINKLTNGKNKARNELIDYMMAKHGLERNQVLADRDAKETAEAGGDYQEAYAENRERDYAGLTALTGEDDVHAAEAKAQQMVAAYEQQHDTTELWDKVNAATKTTLAKLYQCGIMSKETYQKTRDMFEYYIPLRGYDEKTSDKVYGYLTSKDGPLTGGSIMKRAGGRTSKADDPIATIAMMADKAIREGNRNLMKQTFLNFVRNHPSDAVSVSELWLQYDATKDEWVPVFPDIPADASPAEVEQITEQFETDMQQLAQQEPDKYKHGRETANIPYKVIPGNEREHQVLVKMRGQTYVLTINGNPRAAQAINGLTNPDTEATKVIGKILEKAQAINRGMSAVYTTMNPDFVVSNFLRDMYYANTMVYVKEKGNYGVRFNANVAKLNPLTIYYLLQKWENGTLNENRRIEKLFKEFMLNGGETGYTTVWDVERYKKSIDKELRKQNNIVLKAMGTLGGQLEMFNRSVENVARFAAFVTSVEMGRSYGRAAYDAKEISVNFNKKGSGGTMFGATGQTFLGNVGAAVSSVGRQFFVFWNAGVQGMTNFGRNTKRHPVKGGLGAASLFGLGILIPLLAGAGGGDGDDEDKNAYYNLPEYIRRSNLCIYADGKWVTIPLPVEYRAIYGLGELAYGVIAGKERYSDEELAMQISSQFSQLLPIDMLEGGGGWHPFIPTLLKPIVETGTNTSWSGLPIHPDSPFDDGKYMPEYTKVYQSTDKDLIKLSEFLNRVTGGNGRKKGMVDINPANIEYWLNGYLGGLFTFPIKVKKSAETAFGDREFEWKNIPFANRVIKEGDERTEAKKLKNEFFKYKEEYEETKWRLQGYGKDTDQGVFNYAKELADMNYSKEYGRYVIFDKYAKDFEDLEKIKKRIADGTLPAEMKQEYDAEDMRLKRQLVQEMHAYEDGKYTPDKPKAEDQYKPKNEETKVTIQKHAASFDEVRMVDEFSNTGNQYKPANNDVMVEAQKLGMKMRYYKQKNKVKHELGLSGSTWNLDGDKSAEKKRFYNSHKALLDRVGRYRWREREIGRLMDEAKEKKSKEVSNYKRIYQIIQDDIKDEKQFQRSQKK